MMDSSQPKFDNLVCPIPMRQKEKVILSHGSGGRMTKELIESVFMRHFHNSQLDKGNDFADILISGKNQKLIISTDAHIVSPIFFPGGDIGRLAVAGTVNDICMSGGQPRYLSASFILEEGLAISDLEIIAESMQKTALAAGVLIVSGDTKVVEKGKADKIFISTTGIGFARAELAIGGQFARVGDAVILSGSIGDHGIAVLAARNELGFSTTIQSDVAPLNLPVEQLMAGIGEIHVLRDPTRGGLATTLNEIALQSGVTIELDENSIPVKGEVRSACEMLGFDPLYIANEGKMVVILPYTKASSALDLLRQSPLCRDAALIGRVIPSSTVPRVIMETSIGGTRIVDMLSGELLPRIC